MERAEGAYFWDVDGNKYIDYLQHMALLLQGMHIHILQKPLRMLLKQAYLYGTPTTHEVKFAKMLKEAMPING